ARCFIVCGALLLLFTNGANGARYQRTQDGKALVWNNLRGVAEQATWSGLRDLDGYATGEGTLTWYRLGNFVNSYTGKMVRGKFEGPVIREQGQTRLQATFVNGDKVGDWSEPGSTRTLASTPQKQSTETAETQPTEEPVVERPSPSPSPSPSPVPPTLFPTPSPSPTATPSSSPTQSRRLSSSPTPTPAPSRSPSPSSPSPTAIPRGPDSKDRMLAEFKEQTESVLAQVRDATANFREIDRIDAVLNLPAPVSASVASLANRARDFRTKLGYEIAFHESKIETETVDALTVVDQVARSIAE